MNEDLAVLAKIYFDLELPTTLSELKSAFRRESKKYHPDRTKYTGVSNEVRFQEMSAAYAVLTDPDNRKIFQSEEEISNPLTVDGHRLIDLGLGNTGLSKDAFLCTTCTGKGYSTINEPKKWIACETCSGTGAAVECPLCKGRGYGYSTRMRQIVRCHGCQGKKWLSVRASAYRGPLCPSCNGRGGFRQTKTTYKHYVCGDCDGKGERKMFNPLLPPGRISR